VNVLPPGERRAFLVPTLLLLLTLLLPPPGLAQEPATPVLAGQVLRGGEPMEEGTVVLHRVSAAAAGEVDSVSVAAGGGFRFLLPAVPDAERRNEVYFASIRHDGILYFGTAITQAVQLDSLYLIQVYDTVGASPEGELFPVEVRNLIMEEAEEGTGGWRVTDLIQIRNDADRTFVSRDGSAIWSYPLPAGAREFQVGQSDLPEDAVTFDGGRVSVSAPIPPGERLYLFRYILPGIEVTIPLPGLTHRMEFLLREPAPPVGVVGLAQGQPVELEPGSSYRWYAGEDIVEGMVSLTTGGEEREIPPEWIAVGLALLLGVAGLLAVRGRGGSAPARGGGGTGTTGAGRGAEGRRVDGGHASNASSAGKGRVAVLESIVRLDEEFEAGPQGPEDRERYEARRRLLKERLQDLG